MIVIVTECSRPWSHYGGEISGPDHGISGTPTGLMMMLMMAEANGGGGSGSGSTTSISQTLNSMSSAGPSSYTSPSTHPATAPTSSSPVPSAGSGSTLRKFRKSFSLRLTRRSSQEEPHDVSVCFFVVSSTLSKWKNLFLNGV